MIIGLTGKNGAGKTEICRYLEKKGFKYYSLSDILREIAEKRRIEITRENLIKLGNELRAKYSPSILAKILLEKVKASNFVVDSIRNPYEVKEFRKRKDFFLLGVKAKIELRYQRIKERKRAEDYLTFEEFKKLEEIENSNLTTGQQLEKCLKKADFIINNNSTLEELYKKIDILLDKITNL